MNNPLMGVLASTANTTPCCLLVPKPFKFPSPTPPHHFTLHPLLTTRLKLSTPIHVLNRKSQHPPSVTVDYDEDAFYSDYDDEEEENEEEGDMVLPLEKMEKWLENKPRGFGEGKAYDTSIEDELLDKITQSRIAQTLNINNLKKSPPPPVKKPKQNLNNADAGEVFGFRVRITNLPKKKNIQRDLNSAFKEVRGIVNIIPVVLGNKKTRDPVCKGFAFVDFKSEDDASRFVQLFSRQTLAFGRIQKQIKCELINPLHSSSNHSDSESATNLSTVSEGALDDDFDMNESSFKATAADMSDDPDDELLIRTSEDVKENDERFVELELDVGDSVVAKTKSTVSPSSKKLRKTKSITKTTTKEREKKVPKLKVPGSAKKLKIKEKAVLTDVFTKYGIQSGLLSKQEN